MRAQLSTGGAVIHRIGREVRCVVGASSTLLGMTRLRRDLRLLAEHAPDGVLSRADIIGAGISSATICRRCRPGGAWQRLLRGVVMLHGGRPTRAQQVTAAVAYGGPHAMVTGLTAAAQHGVRRLPEQPHVHLLVPHGRHLSSSGFVVVERTRRMPPVRWVAGRPLAPPARALVDAARRMPRLDEVRTMIADAVQLGVCDVGALASELSATGLAGTALPRLVLDEVSDGVRSAAEAWARSLVLRAARLPAPAWNVAIHAADGTMLAVVDAWWDVGLVWEIDSREFHLAPADHDRTARRQSALAAAGLAVVRTVPSRLHRESAAVLAELEGAYRHAALRPRPAVTASPHRPHERGRPSRH